MEWQMPEDGSLEEITSSGLDPELNIIIIQRPDEIREPGETTYTFATLDRTKEGVEWPGDKVLDKLIPGLPKVKVAEVNQPEVTTKTNTECKHSVRRKCNQRPVRRKDYFTTRRPKPRFKRFRSNRSENCHSIDIDPWVHKPWENRALLPTLVTATSVGTTPLISNVPFSNSPTTLLPLRASSNIYNFPKGHAYERNIRLTEASNISLSNSHMGHLNRPPPANKFPVIPNLSFPRPNRFLSGPNLSFPNRFPTHQPGRGFFGSAPNIDFNGPAQNLDFNGPAQSVDLNGPAQSVDLNGPAQNEDFNGPAQNVDFNGPTHKTGLLGETSGARHNVTCGLLGDRPYPNRPFNRNLAMFPNNTSGQSNPVSNAVSLLPREENIGDQNSFISNTESSSVNVNSYDTGYGRIPRSNFDQYKDGNEISGGESHDSYEYPNNTDDSRINSFIGASETNYSRFHNSGNLINHYENQYKNYNHLDPNHPHVKNKNIISLKSPRESYTRKERFQNASTRVSYSERTDSLCENSYNGSQVSHNSKTSLMNKLSRSLSEESLIHISNSTVVYNPKKLGIVEDPASASNSSVPRSSQNSVSRFSNNQNVYTKHTRGRENTNQRQNRRKHNQRPCRFKNWRTPWK